MTDRYDRSMQDLRAVPVPNLWGEIVARAQDPVVHPGEPATRPAGRRRWPVLLAAAASVVLLAAVAGLILRNGGDEPGVVADDTDADATEAPGDTADPSEHDSTPAVDESVTGCGGIGLRSVDPPAGLVGDMETAVDPADPRIPEELRPIVRGVFPGDSTTRAVFLVDGYPTIPGAPDDQLTGEAEPMAPDEATAPLPVETAPDTQDEARDAVVRPRAIFSYDDGWAAQLGVELSDGARCQVTLLGVGLNEADLTRFVSSATVV